MAQTLSNNPRFPHLCRIFRYEESNSFSEGYVKEVYKGVCRKSASTNIRTFNSGKVETGKVDVNDYRISLPGVVSGLRKGDCVITFEELLAEKKTQVVMVGGLAISFDSDIAVVSSIVGAENLMRIVNIEHTRMSRCEYIEDGIRKTAVGGTGLYCNSSSN